MSRGTYWGQELGATVALSTIDGILKEDYVMKNITNTVNMQTYMLSRMTTEKTTAGRRFVFPLRFGVGEGQGNRKENETLPGEGFGEYDQAYGNVQFQYGSMYISGPAIEATEGGRATFASALKQSLKDVRDGFRLETHRQSWGDGTGTMALVDGTVTTSTTVPVKSPYGIAYAAADLEDSQKTRVFRKGMVLWFKTSDLVRTIDAIGSGSITVSASISLTDGERIIRGDGTTLTNEDIEYQGVLAGVKATGTYYGIARSGEPNWQANIIAMGGNPLTEDTLQAAFDTAEIEGDGVTEPDLLISEHKARRYYVALLQSQKRFVNTLDLKGGFKGLDFNGTPWVVDKLCPPERVFYLSMQDWCWFVMKNIGWIQRDGTVLKWVDQKDAYRAVLAAYRNIACKQPANQTVLTGVIS